MKNSKIYLVAIVSMISIGSAMTGCPFTITNDGDTGLIVVDPYNKQAVQIPPGKSRVIDPTLYTWWQFLYNEVLDFYVEHEKGSGTFSREYQMIEKYCTDKPGANDLSLSYIKELVNNPTDRLYAYKYKPYAPVPHKDADAHAH